MSMETHNNFVSTLSDLRVETKLVSFIIICTMIIVACFILNNAYAQSNMVSNDLFGNATKQPTSKETFSWNKYTWLLYEHASIKRRFQITISKELL